MSVTHHILVDEHGKPVPLPFHTLRAGMPITVHDFNDTLIKTMGLGKSLRHQWIRPNLIGLRIITEEEFMEGQQS